MASAAAFEARRFKADAQNGTGRFCWVADPCWSLEALPRPRLWSEMLSLSSAEEWIEGDAVRRCCLQGASQTMKTTKCRVPGRFAVHVPQTIAETMRDGSEGRRFTMGSIEHSPTLSELVSGIADENNHPEFEWGQLSTSGSAEQERLRKH